MQGLARELYDEGAITSHMQVKLLDLCQMLRCGVGWSVSWPVMQYPWVVVNFLTLLVNIVTVLEAAKSGLALGVGILEWNGTLQDLGTETLYPAVSLLCVPAMLYGALEVGENLDNPLNPGYQDNVHAYPRNAWYQCMRANIEAYNHGSVYQLQHPKSTFNRILAPVRKAK